MSNQASSRALAAPTKEERLARLPGAYRNPKEITARLQYAAENFHLVSPATACGAVPEGCSISLSTVIIDVAAETYDVGGKRGLSKVALDKIGAAAGISWDARQSGRIDDGSDPHYCMWRAVGRMRHLDGTEVQLVGTKEMDLRDGSQTAETDKPNQLKEKRLHIAAHAETKARLRAIRSIGIRTAYTKAELEKPFVVAKIMWTGQSADPELRRLFAMKQADAMIGGSRALYGETFAAPAGPPLPALAAPMRPPPVGRLHEPDDDYDAPRLDSRTVDMPTPPPTPAPNTPRPAAQAPQPAAPRPAGDRPPSGVVMKFGKAKGTSIEAASDRDLEWYGEAIAKSCEDPDKARYRDANERELAAIRAEVAWRASGAPAPAPAAGPVGGGDWGDYGGSNGGGGDDEIPF